METSSPVKPSRCCGSSEEVAVAYLGCQGRIPRGAEGGEQGKGDVNGKERGKEFQTEVLGI